MNFVKSFVKKLVGWREESLVRVVMNRTTLEWVQAFDTAGMDACEISGEFWAKRGIPWRSFRNAWYPAFDLSKDLAQQGESGFLPESVDFLFAEQVFEHIACPWRAARNAYRLLRPGGRFLLTVPFLFRIHASPIDCTRWTPQGLKYLLMDAGFKEENIRVDSWGNRQAVKIGGLRGMGYCSRLHSLKNEPNFAVEVWAMAQK